MRELNKVSSTEYLFYIVRIDLLSYIIVSMDLISKLCLT